MTNYERDLLFTTLEFLRKEVAKTFSPDADWKDVDDYIFANLDYTIKDLDAIYEGRNVMVYAGSAIEGYSPCKPTYDELFMFYYKHSQFVYGPCNDGAIGIVVSTEAARPVILTCADVPFLNDMQNCSVQYKITLEHDEPQPSKQRLSFGATENDSGHRTLLYSILRRT